MKTKRFVYEIAREAEREMGLLYEVYGKESIENVIRYAERGYISPLEAAQEICERYQAIKMEMEGDD